MNAPGEEQRSLAPPALADDAHKGDAGRVLCLVGSRSMPGAAVLVARAAQRAGAGLVCVGSRAIEVFAALAVAAPEAVHLDLAAGNATFVLGARTDHALVLGCGLGVETSRELFGAICAANRAVPLVVDADGLNAVAGEPERLRDWPGPLVITPHPGEAERLLGRAPGSDDDARLAAARELARRSGGICCL
ncbi:MAG TPA: NAD(P)H-hydrate dehydratase, partial [Planctomycetota bacterium]|nr:NAD(P)H-hydrate dehydratase [Planctomycetota bacterium]